MDECMLQMFAWLQHCERLSFGEYEEICPYHSVLSGWDGYRRTQPPMYHLLQKNENGWAPPLESFGKDIWVNPLDTALCSSSCACRRHFLEPSFTVLKGPRLYMKLILHQYCYPDPALEEMTKYMQHLLRGPNEAYTLTKFYPVELYSFNTVESYKPDLRFWTSHINVLSLLSYQGHLKKWTQEVQPDSAVLQLLVHGMLADAQLFQSFGYAVLKKLGYLDENTFKKFQRESSSADLHALEQFLKPETEMPDEEEEEEDDDDITALRALRVWLSPEDYKEKVGRLGRMWDDLFWHVRGMRLKKELDRKLSRSRRDLPRLYWPLLDHQSQSSYTTLSTQYDGLVLSTKKFMRQIFNKEHERVLHAVQRLHPTGNVNWDTEIPSNWSEASRKAFQTLHAIIDGIAPEGVGEVLLIITLAMTIRRTLALTDPSSLNALSEEDLYRDISKWQICFQDRPSTLKTYKDVVKETWGLELHDIVSASECDAGSLHLFQDMVSLLISEGKKMVPYNFECPEKYGNGLLAVQKRQQKAGYVKDPLSKPPADPSLLNPHESDHVLQDDHEGVPTDPIEQPEVKRVRGVVKDDPQSILVSWLMMGAIVACVIAGLLLARSISHGLPMPEITNAELCDKRNLVWAARHLCWIMQTKVPDDSNITLDDTELLIENGTIVNFISLVQHLSLHSHVSLREEITVQLMKWRASYMAQFCYSLVEAYLGYKTAHNIVPRREEPMKLSEYDAHLDGLQSRKSTTSASTSNQSHANAARPPSRQPKQCDICKKWFKGGTPALGKHKRNQQCQKPRAEREKYLCDKSGCVKNYLSHFDLEEHQRKDHGLLIGKRKYEKTKSGEKEEEGRRNNRLETGLADLTCF